MDKIKDKLLKYQIQHTENLVRILQNNMACLDASDTGTGKTYTAIGVAKMLKCKPFIICPKSVISNWIQVCKYFDCEILGIANYEMLKNCMDDLIKIEEYELCAEIQKQLEKKKPGRKKQVKNVTE